ncbi:MULTISPECIES: response regulator transcription factor [unclassified Luteococcus]|uniref:response regulator transcription factor n=1 Tax=unclassified Luteococcus TaxID=2639923 RepID=UPI00313E9F53
MDTDVLMIDDERDLVSSTLEYLAAFGLTGAGVGSAEEAVEWLADNTTRVVLLDINLPGASGFDLCRRIREHSQTPIIIASARRSEDDEIMALMLGGDDYLRKPFSLGVLLAKLRRTLERGAAGQPQQAGYDDGHLRFDQTADRFFVDGQPLELTAMEHKLLRHLVSNPERVLTKQELFQQVWGESITGDGTLSVHIRRLRTRIEPDLDNPRYIQTLWGRGYLFRDLRP